MRRQGVPDLRWRERHLSFVLGEFRLARLPWRPGDRNGRRAAHDRIRPTGGRPGWRLRRPRRAPRRNKRDCRSNEEAALSRRRGPVREDFPIGTPPASRPTRPRLPVRRGDAAAWRARSIVSHGRLNSKHKSGSLAGSPGLPLETAVVSVHPRCRGEGRRRRGSVRLADHVRYRPRVVAAPARTLDASLPVTSSRLVFAAARCG